MSGCPSGCNWAPHDPSVHDHGVPLPVRYPALTGQVCKRGHRLEVKGTFTNRHGTQTCTACAVA